MKDIHAIIGEFKNTVEDFLAMVIDNVFLDIASLSKER